MEEVQIELKCATCGREQTHSNMAVCNGCAQEQQWQCSGCTRAPKLTECSACGYKVCSNHSTAGYMLKKKSKKKLSITLCYNRVPSDGVDCYSVWETTVKPYLH